MRLRYTLPILTTFLILLGGNAVGGVPGLINYQGRLTDDAGNPVSGMYSIKFRVYDAAVDGNDLWSSDGFVGVEVENGLFSHVMGSSNLLPDSLARYDSLWLGIAVYNEPEMTPRTQMVATPYSLRAGYADHSVHSDSSIYADTSQYSTFSVFAQDAELLDGHHAADFDSVEHARSADTAEHSLDKTVDASELVAGTLDTARYSAYTDLESESSIGDGVGQLAPGDHSHSVSGMAVLDDMALIETVISAHTVDTIKTLTIPPSSVESYFKVFWCAGASYNVNHTGKAWFKLLVNNTQVATSSMLYGDMLQEVWFFRTRDDTWRGTTLLDVDSSEPIVVTVTAQTEMIADTYNIYVGHLVVLYTAQ